MSENIKGLLFAILIGLVCAFVAYGGYNSGRREAQAQIELIEQEKEYYEMMVLYLEAKADYYETVHNIDLDDTDDGFILYMIKEHPDVYIYFMERKKGE